MNGKFKRGLAVFSGLVLAMQGFILPAKAAEGDIQTIFDLSDMYTTGNIYSSNSGYTGGNAGYAGAWYYNDFVSDKNITWKNPWQEGETDNIAIVNGVEFKLRVINGNSGNCVMRNRSDSVYYTNLDVDDGAYTSIEFLANSDRPTTVARRIGVKLNYADGTSEAGEYALNLFSNSIGTTENTKVGIKSTRCNTTNLGYLAHINVNVNPEKELVSVDIINDRFEWVTDANGEYVIENGEYKINTHADANSRGKYKFVTQIYAVTLITNEAVVEAAKEAKIQKQIAEIEDAITALGEIDSLEYSQKEDVDYIGELLETAKNDGINVEEKISNYQTYLLAVEKMEELYRMTVYEDIKDLIDALGSVEDLKYSQKADLDEITSKIAEAEENGYAVNSETLSNYDVYEQALVRMEELYIEGVLKKIEDKITALGDINALKYEDQPKLDEIQEMIDSAEDEGIAVNSETLSNYNTYKEAIEIVKGMMPVSKIVDISALYNVSNIYGPNGADVTGSAGYAGRWVYDSVINDLTWKYEWDEERIDNVTNVNGVDYQLRVLDYSKNTGSCVFRNNKQTEQYTNIDVEDGNYMAVNILANSDRATNYPKCLGVKLNYSDGSSNIAEKSLAYFPNGFGKDAKGGITAIRMSKDSNPDTKGYVANFEIEADYNKVLTSIDIINDCFLFTTDEEGNYVYENGEPLLQKGETGRDKAYHGAQVYAVSVTLPYSQYVKEIKEKLVEMEKSLDDRFDVSDGIISETAKDVFFDMKEKFEYLQDEEYMSGFSNYNEINSAMPELVSADFEEKNDIIEATLEFNTEMKNIEDYIKISQGDKEIDKYVLSSEGKIVKISFNNNYNYEADYKITVSKYAASTLSENFTMGLTKAYKFLPQKGITIANIKIADASGKEIENIKEYSGDEIKISAKVSNNSKETASYFAIAGLYDEKGQLVACKNIAKTLQGGKSENVNTTLSTGGRSGLTLKIIWLDMAESMKTVADTIIK